jgi:hypothetical protein
MHTIVKREASVVEDNTSDVLAIHDGNISSNNTCGKNIQDSDFEKNTDEALFSISFSSQLSWASQEDVIVKNIFIFPFPSNFHERNDFFRE